MVKKSFLVLSCISCLFSFKLVENQSQNSKLIFIYNAKSGFINGVFDYVHKFVSPQTYACNLCSLTYDNTGKKNEWSDYLNSLPIEVLFTYKDNLLEDGFILKNRNYELPCIVILDNHEERLFVSKNEIDSVNNLEDLIDLVNKKIYEANLLD